MNAKGMTHALTMHIAPILLEVSIALVMKDTGLLKN